MANLKLLIALCLLGTFISGQKTTESTENSEGVDMT